MIYLYKTHQIDYEIKKIDSKTTFLLLHGWGADKNAFQTSENMLLHYGNVLKITLPTVKTNGVASLSLDDYCNITNQILKLNSINNVAVICHSFGFRVALKMMQKCNNITDIFITAGAGLKKKKCLFKKINTEHRIILMRDEKKHKQKLFQMTASKDYQQLNSTERITFKNIVNEDLTNNIKKINNCKNIHLFWGVYDKETPLNFAKLIKKICPKSKSKFIKNGHFAYLDKPNEFKFELNNFCREVTNG